MKKLGSGLHSSCLKKWSGRNIITPLILGVFFAGFFCSAGILQYGDTAIETATAGNPDNDLPGNSELNEAEKANEELPPGQPGDADEGKHSADQAKAIKAQRNEAAEKAKDEALDSTAEAELAGNPEEEGASASDEEATARRPVAEDNAPIQSGQVKISHESFIDELLRRLSSPDERTRLEAGLALRKSATLVDVDQLVRILKKGNNRDKQLFIIETLGGLQDKRAGEGLRFEVEHGDEETRRAAVTALGNLNFNWPIPVLVKVLRREQDEELRKRAASALGMIGSPQAIYALRTSLSLLDDAPGAKNAAFWALERARGEVDENQIDTDMPRGRRLSLMYKGTRYYLYHPANRREASTFKTGLRPWLLVCIHDGDLRAEDVFNICYKSAKKTQMAVLVPVIDNMKFPGYGDFNIRGQRFDKRLLELIDHVGNVAGLNTRELYMFGYGTGGDFVQKFVLSYPKRIAKAAYECDKYTMPDPELYFPRGTNKTPMAPDINVDMYQFMKTDQMLIVRKNSPVLRDGRAYYDAMEQYSDVNGIRARIGIRTVDVKYEIWGEAEKFLYSYE